MRGKKSNLNNQQYLKSHQEMKKVANSKLPDFCDPSLTTLQILPRLILGNTISNKNKQQNRSTNAETLENYSYPAANGDRIGECRRQKYIQFVMKRSKYATAI